MSTDDLRCIVYVSTARWMFTREELDALLATSRANNEAQGVTGCLLYSGGSIMQLLEGPAGAVRATYERIRGSEMHKDLIKILDAPLAAREFAAWSMAFNRATAEEFFRLRESLQAESAPPSRGLRLLKQFWSPDR